MTIPRPIPRIVIAAYRPKPGKAAILLGEVRDHHPLLRSEGLATDRAPIIARTKDGVIVEVFEWASAAAIAEAHENSRVTAMWARFNACCDPVPLNTLAPSADLFAELEPVEFDHTLPPSPSPDQREE